MAYSRTEHIGRITLKGERLSLSSDGYCSVVRFRLAVDRDYKRGDGTVITDFFNCVAFGNLAEAISKYYKRGDTVFVVGRNMNVEWTDESNNERRRDEIVLERCELIHRSGERSNQ
ncbi:MAG: single-stranded DNA-binding protein [Clostridia bacterium]|nr:single-stranded DNA-binding protein [Clostridia bacterium]